MRPAAAGANGGIPMTKWILGLAVSLGLLLGLASPAAALDTSQSFENRMLPSLDQVAAEYWGSRGLSLPPLAAYLVSEEAEVEGAGAEGTLGASGVWVTEWAINELLVGQPWEVRAIFCVLWLHERGHNAGLTHHVGWAVMHEHAYFDPPPRCNSWARSVAATRPRERSGTRGGTRVSR